MLIANQLFFSASDHFLPIKTRQETEEQECLYFHRCVLQRKFVMSFSGFPKSIFDHQNKKKLVSNGMMSSKDLK